MTNLYLYGAGGHGKVVLDAMSKLSMACNAFIDDKDMPVWSGLPVIKFGALEANFKIHIAIGNSQIRQKIANIKYNIDYFSVIHPLASIAFGSQLLSGVFIAANAVLGPDTTVGMHTIINHGAIVDHDCVVGDFCHIAPNAVLGGGVKLGNHVLIGAGAVVLPGIQIGDHVTIGAGAVVTSNISSNSVYVGVPAKPLINK